MSEELDKLSSLGVQKIYDDTRIPVHHIQAILHNSFDGLTRVQLLGFISILEREYNYKLDTLKVDGLAYFDEKDERNLDTSLFVVSHKKRTKAPLYITIAILLFVVALVFNYFILNQENTGQSKVNNALIEDVQENIIATKANLTDDNSSDKNISHVEDVEDNIALIDTQESNLSQILNESFKIVPRSKVWLGYIDVDTNQKHQITIENEMDLDPDKKWLLFFGHGYIDMSVNGDVKKFSSRNRRRFLYENHTLKDIDLSEFEELSRGLKW